MSRKRYEKKFDLTVRIPKPLRDRARMIVQAIEDRRIETPETNDLVKPSIAVLALRGLEMELELWNGVLAGERLKKDLGAKK
jgi:hypothetical protein